MPIVSSEIASAIVQADGRISVTESHVDQSGIEYRHNYLAGADMDLQAILALRAANMGAELDRRERQIAEASNFEIPLTLRSFMDRLTVNERIAIRTLAKTDPVVEDLLKYLEGGQVVYLSHAATQQGLAYLQSVGLLTAQRVNEIGAVL